MRRRKPTARLSLSCAMVKVHSKNCDGVQHWVVIVDAKDVNACIDLMVFSACMKVSIMVIDRMHIFDLRHRMTPPKGSNMCEGIVCNNCPIINELMVNREEVGVIFAKNLYLYWLRVEFP